MASFPEEFHRVESSKLRLEEGGAFIDKKTSNGFKVVYTSFGLESTVSSRKADVKEKLPVNFHKIKDFLNGQKVEDVSERPIAARRLEMPPRSFRTPKTKGTLTSLATSPNSGGLLNLKDISENTDLDTPEKMFLIKNGQVEL